MHCKIRRFSGRCEVPELYDTWRDHIVISPAPLIVNTHRLLQYYILT